MHLLASRYCVILGVLGVPLCAIIRSIQIFLVLVFPICQNLWAIFFFSLLQNISYVPLCHQHSPPLTNCNPYIFFLANNNLNYILVYIHPLWDPCRWWTITTSKFIQNINAFDTTGTSMYKYLKFKIQPTSNTHLSDTMMGFSSLQNSKRRHLNEQLNITLF